MITLLSVFNSLSLWGEGSKNPQVAGVIVSQGPRDCLMFGHNRAGISDPTVPACVGRFLPPPPGWQ